MSRRRAKLLAKRRLLVRELVENRGGLCARWWAHSTSGASVPAMDPHEVLSRGRGGSIVNAAIIVLLCRGCHDWVTANPKQAEAEGLLVPSWAGAAELEEAGRRRAERGAGA